MQHGVGGLVPWHRDVSEQNSLVLLNFDLLVVSRTLTLSKEDARGKPGEGLYWVYKEDSDRDTISNLLSICTF